jgi:hypothetical protein
MPRKRDDPRSCHCGLCKGVGPLLEYRQRSRHAKMYPRSRSASPGNRRAPRPRSRSSSPARRIVPLPGTKGGPSVNVEAGDDVEAAIPQAPEEKRVPSRPHRFDEDSAMVYKLNRPLYPGAKGTAMDLVSDLLAIGSKSHLANAPIEAVFEADRKALPEGHNLPAFRSVDGFVTTNVIPGYQQLHACPLDHILFIDSKVRPEYQYAALDRCPRCNASRYEEQEGKGDTRTLSL